MMDVKYGLLFFVLFACSWALPKPENGISRVDRSARIVGGTVAPEGKDPHMVYMTTGQVVRTFICGGSILSARTVLTAAHCILAVFGFFVPVLDSSLRVTVGTNQWNSGGDHYAISRNITHPHYLFHEMKNDLGLLITTTDIVFSDRVWPVTLGFNFVASGVPVRVVGWGDMWAGGPLSDDLLEINVITLEGQACSRAIIQAGIDKNTRPPPVEPHIELCTFHSVGTGTCHGDSGGPLTRVDNGHQVGIVSWGFPCADGVPDVFVRISAYRSWFEQSIVY